MRKVRRSLALDVDCRSGYDLALKVMMRPDRPIRRFKTVNDLIRQWESGSSPSRIRPEAVRPEETMAARWEP